MALGDNDLASGVFFADFGDTITCGDRSVKGVVEAPGKDGIFDKASVSDAEYRVMVAANAFDPAPKPKDCVTVEDGRFANDYIVRSVDPVDDGALVEIRLRKK